MERKCSWLLTAALTAVLAGCNADLLNRDAVTLDKLSRAYTDFRDATFDARVGFMALSDDPDPVGYWKEMRDAVDSHSDAARLQHAAKAVDAYESRFPGFIERLGENLHEMDKAVLRMVEVANSVQTLDYRKDAVEAAKAAREVHTAFLSVQEYSEKRLRMTVGVLRAMVSNGGRIPQRGFVFDASEAKTVEDQLQQAGAQALHALQRLKDSLSALKGKSGMKAYPLREDKYDKHENTPKQ
jgi:hypothetical protein